MSAQIDAVARIVEARLARRLNWAREVAREPDLRTADELIDAAALLERAGADEVDRALARRARRAAHCDEEVRRWAALEYLHRRSVARLISACWKLAALAVLSVALLAATHLFHP